MAKGQEEDTLIEETEEEMVASIDSQQPIKRKCFFLKPISDNSNSSSNLSFCDKFCSKLKTLEAPKVHFNGWVCILRNWDQWVKKLKPMYKDLWKKVGIFDAVSASTYRFKRDPSSLFGVARFWCAKTNTFLFPWGEATVTLEDVMILGGYSVLGEPVRVNEPLDGELGELESQMIREVKKFNQSKCKKADISTWMKHFMEEGNGDEMEHIAFLTLWLTRFVLLVPPARTIGNHVIPVAIRLARGTRIAFAPAVLASLYRDLRKMKDYVVSGQRPDTSPLTVWAPLHILQLWIWERFLALSPESSNFVNSHEPRVARWHDVGKKLGNNLVMSVVKSLDEFQWRPYIASLDHWCKPSHIRDGGGWFCNNEVVDEGMESFIRCLRACELVGIDCIEQYLPNRVARQFGYDQDLPKNVLRANVILEVAWRSFDVSAKNVKFYLPSKVFKSDITIRYSVWWDRVQRLLRKKMKGKKRKKNQSPQSCKNVKVEEINDIQLSDLQQFKKKNVQGSDDIQLSDLQWFKKENVQGSDDMPFSDMQRHEKIEEQDTDDILLSDLHFCRMRRVQDIAVTPLSDQRCMKVEVQDIDDLPLSDLCCKKKKVHDSGDMSLSSLQCRKKKVVQGGVTSSLSDRLAKKYQSIGRKRKCLNSLELSTYAAAIQVHQACMENTKAIVELKPSVASLETMKHDADALINFEVENGPVTSNPVDIKNNGVVAYIEATSVTSFQDPRACIKNSLICPELQPSIESSTLIKQDNEQDDDTSNDVDVENGQIASKLLDTGDHVEEKSAGESVYDPIVMDELEESSKIEGVEERTAEKRSTTEADIEKLKDEIALIHARVKELESLAEVHH